MAYTLKTLVDDAQMYTQRSVLNESVGRPEIKALAYEAIIDTINDAQMADPAFYTKSLAFTTTTSLAKPSDYKDAVLIEVPLAEAGAATIVDAMDWEERLSNTRLAPDSNNPIARLDETVITISPTRAGTLHYIWTVTDGFLATESTDLEAYVPTLFIPGVLLKLLELIHVRSLRDANNRTRMEDMLKKLQRQMKSRRRASLQLNLAKSETTRPTYGSVTE